MSAEFSLEQIRAFVAKGYQSVAARYAASALEQLEAALEFNNGLSYQLQQAEELLKARGQGFDEAMERKAYNAFNKLDESSFLDDDDLSRYERGLMVWLAAKKEAAEQQGLDLVDLERKLDRALEGENTKDLLDWLNTKRLAPTPYNEEAERQAKVRWVRAFWLDIPKPGHLCNAHLFKAFSAGSAWRAQRGAPEPVAHNEEVKKVTLRVPPSCAKNEGPEDATEHTEAVLFVREPAFCQWSEDADGQWDTGCGNVFEFTTGGPQENGAKFCPYCGGRLDPKYIQQ